MVPAIEKEDAMVSGTLVAGLDLGSTNIKILIVDEAGTEVVSEQVTTPWRAAPQGFTELDAATLTEVLTALLQKTSSILAVKTAHRVAALAISGMAETGVLIDATGDVITPGIAWFDPRGVENTRGFSAQVRQEFSGRTGLPLGAQVSVSKLAYFRDAGLSLQGLRWLDLQEYVAWILGGDLAGEYSLVSRTGLLDQDTGRPWNAMLQELGIDESFFPPLRHAGEFWGRARGAVAGNFAGALLTVAGHDHLVTAEASGELTSDRYLVAMGTAEVLLRVIDAPLGYAARQRLANALINEVQHVVPGKHVLMAPLKTGLVLRRTLQMLGISDRAGRDHLDAEVSALPLAGELPEGAVLASGARNDDGELALTVRADGISPAETFGAVLRHSNEEVQRLITAIDQEIPPAVSTILTGGWAGMASVQRARAAVLPNISVSPREQETAFGAALFARKLLETSDAPGL